ncbi:sulfotransferase [Gemmatimonadota bacterium]
MRKFVVVSQQRAGSHMMMNMLSSHPSVHCNSDLLTKEVRAHGAEWAFAEGFRLPPRYPERSPLPKTKQPESVGFLIKIKQDLHQQIHELKDLKVILLHRKNRLATLLSKKVSYQLGTYADPKRRVSLEEAALRRAKMPPLRIETEEAESFFEEWSAKTEEVIRCLEGTDWLQVIYEEVRRDPEKTMRVVYRHLGVPFHPIQSRPGWGAEKLDPRPIREAIENYEELKEKFLGSRWEEFFIEERAGGFG